MNDILVISEEKFVTTVDLLDKLNELRAEVGERPMRNNQFLVKVRDELPELEDDVLQTFCSTSDMPRGGVRRDSVQGYYLNQEQAALVSMRVSKTIRRRMLRWVKSLEQQLLINGLFDKRQVSWQDQRDALGLLPDAPGPGASERDRGIYYGKETNLVYRVVTGQTAKALINDPARSCHPGKDPDRGYSYLTSIEVYWVDLLQGFNTNMIKSGATMSIRQPMLERRFEALKEEHETKKLG